MIYFDTSRINVKTGIKTKVRGDFELSGSIIIVVNCHLSISARDVAEAGHGTERMCYYKSHSGRQIVFSVLKHKRKGKDS